MKWQQHFFTVFFNEWMQAGLPHPQHYTAAYIDARVHSFNAIPFVDEEHADATGIPYHQLRSVYGFGKVIGELLCDWLQLPGEHTKHVACWCGRFNLGISLFDYVCDELKQKEALQNLDAFQVLFSHDKVYHKPLNAVEELLNTLAASVLTQLKNNSFELVAPVMRSMFEAEYLLADKRYEPTTGKAEIKKLLYLKSVEPFKVMALYAGTYTKKTKHQLASVCKLGELMGNCYCLIDDACDLMEDVKNERWNLFLAELMPSLGSPPQPEKFAAFTEQLINDKYAYSFAKTEVYQIAKLFNKTVLPEEKKNKMIGFIGASLWQWA